MAKSFEIIRLPSLSLEDISGDTGHEFRSKMCLAQRLGGTGRWVSEFEVNLLYIVGQLGLQSWNPANKQTKRFLVSLRSFGYKFCTGFREVLLPGNPVSSQMALMSSRPPA